MTPRFVRLSLALALLSTATRLLAQAPAAPLPETPPLAIPPAAAIRPVADEMIPNFKLSAAPVDAILGALELYTGRTILRPGALPTAEYTIKIDRPIPKSELVLALQTLLALNQIGVTAQGDRFLKVVALAAVKTEAPEMIEGSALAQPASGKIATKIFQLDFLRVSEFMPQIQGLLTAGINGGTVILEKTNAALVTDTVSNLQRIETLLKTLDRPATSGLKPKFYTLRNGAKASDLVNKLRTILSGTLQTQLGTSTTYNADDRTNQIILIADARQYPFFDDLIDKLDIKSDPNTRNEVIYLKHAAAKDVSALLSTMVTGQATAAQKASAQSVRPGQVVMPGQPAVGPQPALPQPVMAAATAAIGESLAGSNEFSTLITVAYDERSNAVLVSGTGDDIRLIKDIVDKLDIILAQVRIEIVIAEVTLSDNTSSGITQLGLKVNGDRLVGLTGSAPGFALAGTADATGTGGSGFAEISRKGGPRTFTSSLDLSGVIGLSSKNPKASANLLSVPTITTTHNKEAIIFVGETRPTINSVTSSTAGQATVGATTSSITQQEIGLTITVKPLIGNDGSVQLDLKQELSDTGDPVTIDGNVQNVINKRRTQSFITAKSGEILVLGGLQKKTNKRSSSRFGPFPFIGDLLGARTRDELRTELIFFLRPIVLTNTAADNISALKQVDEFPNKDAVLQELDPTYVAPKKTVIDKVFRK